MALVDIQIQDKSYVMKHTMKVKEYEQVMHLLKMSNNISKAIKDQSDPDVSKFIPDLNDITVKDFDTLKEIVQRCFEIDENTIGEMEYADILYLFSEVMTVSRNPKKKLLKESPLVSTTQKTPPS